MKMEIVERSKEVVGQLGTIYFGGGTPSVLSAEEISSLLDCIRSHYTLDEQPEITLEANPEDVTYSKAVEWSEKGINRISLGMQSFDDNDLQWMNRGHTVKQSLEAVNILVEQGINNISADLIFGLPEQSLEKWEQNLNQLLDLNINHVSLYNLTVEPKTALAFQVKNKKVLVGTDELAANQFKLGQKLLTEVGFEQYEISNYAKKGFESKHNSSYWRNVHYLGVGPSAHSFDGKTRRWNVSNNQNYMKAIEGKQVYWESEELSTKDRYNEYVLTGLRSKWGCDMDYIESEFNIDLTRHDEVAKQLQGNTVIIQDRVLLLTETGMLIADHIALNLFLD
jgi:oxygen-independent coproporphyrinogen III oxidase